MAGEDTQTLANGNDGEALTIISPPPPPSSDDKVTNGHHCKRHNNNGVILQNGKVPDIVNGENGKLVVVSLDVKSNGIHDDDEQQPNVDPEISCGWGPCRPRWLQLFATKQAFLAIFCITWVLQGMYYTYFVSVITTIEKLFQIQSKTTGIIMSATEIGQIGSSLLLTYYGGQGHRPKWIAWGMLLFAVSSFTCSMPHFIFGEQLIKQNEMLFSGVGTGNEPGGPNKSIPVPANLCRLPGHENDTVGPNGLNESS